MFWAIMLRTFGVQYNLFSIGPGLQSSDLNSPARDEKISGRLRGTYGIHELPPVAGLELDSSFSKLEHVDALIFGDTRPRSRRRARCL